LVWTLKQDCNWRILWEDSNFFTRAAVMQQRKLSGVKQEETQMSEEAAIELLS
jgi:hypothetical protein